MITDGLPAIEVASATLDRGYSDYLVAIDFGELLPSLLAAGEVDAGLCATGWKEEEAIGVALGARRRKLARLVAVGVAPEHRRDRIGRELCQRVVDLTHEAGAREIVLEALTINEPALRLYASLGFERRRRLVGFEPQAGGPPLDRAALRAALEDPVVSPSWQLATAVERATAADDLIRMVPVVPEDHAVARLMLESGFVESELAQYELGLVLGDRP